VLVHEAHVGLEHANADDVLRHRRIRAHQLGKEGTALLVQRGRVDGAA